MRCSPSKPRHPQCLIILRPGWSRPTPSCAFWCRNRTTIRDPAGSLIVTITSEPGLHSGHRFRLIMDGQPVGEPGTSPVFPLQNIDRGTHQLSAEVIDSQGRIVERTPAQPFHMKRITLAEKRRTNPCQKEDWGVRLECPLKDKPKDPPKDIPLIPFI